MRSTNCASVWRNCSPAQFLHTWWLLNPQKATLVVLSILDVPRLSSAFTAVWRRAIRRETRCAFYGGASKVLPDFSPHGHHNMTCYVHRKWQRAHRKKVLCHFEDISKPGLGDISSWRSRGYTLCTPLTISHSVDMHWLHLSTPSTLHDNA